MSAVTSHDVQPALLFVPDISGFTQFVQGTAITHSRHIIEELLEKLIEANDIDLQISEIEGDAILFYRFGGAPTAEEYFHQVEKMFLAFHGHLRLYETQRICQCGACATAHDLTLKIVAHYGGITQTYIKGHAKLFGQEVITVHRLLKNDISNHEYALFTEALTNEWPPQAFAAAWASPEAGSQDYDVGTINYGYVPLAALRQSVPEPRAVDFSIPGRAVQVFASEQVANAPLDLVFDVVSDLPARLEWIEGARNVEMLNHHLNRVGTKHRCVVDETSPIMVTSGGSRAADTITVIETDEKKTMSAVYTLRREGDTRTRIRIDGFLKDNLLLRVLFALLLKKKLTTLFSGSNENLKRYCEALHDATS